MDNSVSKRPRVLIVSASFAGPVASALEGKSVAYTPPEEIDLLATGDEYSDTLNRSLAENGFYMVPKGHLRQEMETPQQLEYCDATWLHVVPIPKNMCTEVSE